MPSDVPYQKSLNYVINEVAKKDVLLNLQGGSVYGEVVCRSFRRHLY